MALLPLFSLALAIFMPTTRSLDYRITNALMSLIFLEPIMFFTSMITIDKMKNLSVSLYADRLERIMGKSVESVLFKDIQTCEIIELSSGKIKSIKLTSNTGKIILLHGVDDMQAVVTQIENLIPNSTPIHKKKEKFNWNSPLGLIIPFTVIPIILILVMRTAGKSGIYVISTLLSFFIGIYFLFYKPASRSISQKYRIFEIVYSVIILIIALAQTYYLIYPE